jgi:hypothetical protein
MVPPLAGLGVASPPVAVSWDGLAHPPNLAAATPREVREAYCKKRRREEKAMETLREIKGNIKLWGRRVPVPDRCLGRTD